MESILVEMEERMQKMITLHFEAAHKMLDRIQPRQPRGEPNRPRRDHLSTATIFEEIKPALTLPKSTNNAFRPENHQSKIPSDLNVQAKDEQVAAASSLSSQPKAEEQKQEENCSYQLTLDSNNEEATKNSLVLNKSGSTDESANVLSERSENKVKSLLAEVMKPQREEQLVYFRSSKT